MDLLILSSKAGAMSALSGFIVYSLLTLLFSSISREKIKNIITSFHFQKHKRKMNARYNLLLSKLRLRGGGPKKEDSTASKILAVLTEDWQGGKGNASPSVFSWMRGHTIQATLLLMGLAKLFESLLHAYEKIEEMRRNFPLPIPIETSPLPIVVDQARYRTNFLRALLNVITANPLTTTAIILVAASSIYITFSANMSKERAFISSMVTSLTGLTGMQFQQFMKNFENMMAQSQKREAEYRIREDQARKESASREDAIRKENLLREDSLRKENEVESKKQAVKYEKKTADFQTCLTEKTVLTNEKKDLLDNSVILWNENRICTLNQGDLITDREKLRAELDRLHTIGLPKKQIGTPEVRRLLLGTPELKYKTDVVEVIQKKLPQPDGASPFDEVIPVLNPQWWNPFKK
jgi:hypothetical protein